MVTIQSGEKLGLSVESKIPLNVRSSIPDYFLSPNLFDCSNEIGGTISSSIVNILSKCHIIYYFHFVQFYKLGLTN